MNTQELRTVAVLASIFALRMLGLCMLLPVFAIAAAKYSGVTAQLIGVAVGVYGLLQAVLQVPLGMLSDRLGRRPVIILGLGLVLLGSVVAMLATSIYGLIAGRALQGCGAIGSVVIATLADHTREQVRSSAMAILGASIGMAFALAMVAGPWLEQAFGLGSIFVVTCLMAFCCMLLMLLLPNTKPLLVVEAPHIPTNFKLINLNFGALVLHAGLAALFLILPVMLQQQGLQEQNVWRVYLGVLLVAMLLVWRLLRYSERNGLIEKMQIIAIMGLILAPTLMYVADQMLWSLGCLVVYFTAFCLLEASLPTLVAKHANAQKRGAAMGMYATMQFLGVFFGGIIGGWLHGNFGVTGVVGFSVGLAACWLMLSVILGFRKEVKIWQEV